MRGQYVEWKKTFGGTKNDRPSNIKKTSLGQFIITGATNSFDGDFSNNKGKDDFFLLKLNSNGDKEWIKNYGGSNDDGFCFYGDLLWPKVFETIDKGYIITGASSSNDTDFPNNHSFSNGWDFGIIRTDSLGNRLWSKNYGGYNLDFGTSFLEKKNGNFIILGATVSSDGDFLNLKGNSPYLDFAIIGIDNVGNINSAKLYGGTGIDISSSIKENNENNILIFGTSTSKDGDFSQNYGNQDMAVIKVDSSGKKLWAKNYGGVQKEEFHSAVETSNGDYILCGSSESGDGVFNQYNGGVNDLSLIRIDKNGMVIWAKNYGGSGSEYPLLVENGINDELVIYLHSDSNDGGYSSSGLSIFQLTVDKNGLTKSILKLTENRFGNPYLILPLEISKTYIYCYGANDSNGQSNIQVEKISLEIKSIKANIIPPSCKGSKNGSIGFQEITGGISPFTYTWDNPNLTGNNPQNLAAGTYKLTVTDANGSTKTETFVLTEPDAVTASFSTTGAKCGQNNGSITINANGGTAPYSYNWNNSNTINNLSPGVQSVVIRDSKGCESEAYKVTVSATSLPQFTLTPNSILCKGNTMALTATGTGNSYLWNTGEKSDNIKISPSFSTAYSVVATNSEGCTISKEVTITVNSAAKPIIQSAGGALATNATGAIQWFFNGAPIVGQTTFVFAPTKSGIYSVQNTENGCNAMSDPFAFTAVSDSDVSEFKNINIFPNPVHDKIVIQNIDNQLFSNMGIIDEQGRSIANYELKEKETTISCVGWLNGMYFIYFYNDKQKLLGVSKIIKQ